MDLSRLSAWGLSGFFYPVSTTSQNARPMIAPRAAWTRFVRIDPVPVGESE
jgi:hypothetical protein